MFRLTPRLATPLLVLAAVGIASGTALAQTSRPSREPGQAQPASLQRPEPQPQATQQAQYPSELPAEAKSRQACEAVADRVFVQHDLGSECVAYFATPPQARAGAAVFYFEGDVPAADLQKPNFARGYLTEARNVFQRLSSQHGVRFVFVARPGVFGSSGNHGARRSIGEMLTMNAAVDALKARLGIQSIVLAGQSGGSTIGAALLTLGRRDIACAVLGSGLLSVVEIEYAHRVRERLPEIKPALMHVHLFDPTDRLDWIERQPGRRIFVLGDPTDTRTPFPQQRAFADRVKSLGHHAEAIQVAAQGELMHGVAHHTLPAAALCARGVADTAIRTTVAPQPRPVARTLTSEVVR